MKHNASAPYHGNDPVHNLLQKTHNVLCSFIKHSVRRSPVRWNVFCEVETLRLANLKVEVFALQKRTSATEEGCNPGVQKQKKALLGTITSNVPHRQKWNWLHFTEEEKNPEMISGGESKARWCGSYRQWPHRGFMSKLPLTVLFRVLHEWEMCKIISPLNHYPLYPRKKTSRDLIFLQSLISAKLIVPTCDACFCSAYSVASWKRTSGFQIFPFCSVFSSPWVWNISAAAVNVPWKQWYNINSASPQINE